MEKLKKIFALDDICKYYDALRSRPALILALIVMTSIVILRGLIEGANGSIDGYDRNSLNNPFSNAGIGEGQHVCVTGEVDSVQIKEYSEGEVVYNLLLSNVEFASDTDDYCDKTAKNHPNSQSKITRTWEKINISVSSIENVRIGQFIKVKGKLKYHSRATNWGEFDSYKYYSRRGIVCKLDSSEIVAYGLEYDEIREYLWRFRQKVDACIETIYGEEDGAILKAMLLGNKNEIPERIKEAFQKCGIGHILAISGLHISFICMSIYKLLESLRVVRWINILISEIIMLLYITMVGLTASSVRAAVMFSMFIISRILRRSYDMISAAAVASIIISGFNPWSLWDFSFQLSFLAIVGLGICTKNVLNNSMYLKVALKKRDSTGICGKLYNSLVVGSLRNFTGGFMIFYVTLPVLLWGYYEVATYSVMLNLLILPLMPVLLVSSILGISLTATVGSLGRIFVMISKLILGFYKISCIYMEENGIGRINVGKPESWKLFVFYLLVGLFCICKGKHSYITRAVCIIMCSVLLIQDPDGIYMLDVGQGDSFVIVHDRKAYIMDGGSTSKKQVGNNVIIPFLKSKGVNKIEGIYISHPDEDHINGIYELVEQGKLECLNIKNVFVYRESLNAGEYEALEKLTKSKDINIIGISKGYQFCKSNLNITCLYPDIGIVENENDNSLVLSVKIGKIRFIETGDVEKTGENMLLSSINKGDILKIAHHGSSSSTSEEFLNKVSPRLALISAGENNRYGHPHEEVVEALDRHGIIYLNTAYTGAVWVRPGKNGLKVKCYM